MIGWFGDLVIERINHPMTQSLNQLNHPINHSLNPSTITQSPNHPITR
jgi:hypothetical protein